MGREQIEQICQILIRKIISPSKVKMPLHIDSLSFQYSMDWRKYGIQSWIDSAFFVDDFYHMNRNDL
jgi:hypothetical protein